MHGHIDSVVGHGQICEWVGGGDRIAPSVRVMSKKRVWLNWVAEQGEQSLAKQLWRQPPRVLFIALHHAVGIRIHSSQGAVRDLLLDGAGDDALGDLAPACARPQ